ncbi:uncharacterized protein LTR77_002066 [Saxophila tyrrhenica]|uniref:ADP-ribosylation factor GTPase-activating protein n=1 Tax=Saxophila tyrrhenica TaxID=1690608 RepID=A0AAV9PKZ8_9PEZI|nr:hypothetical protein LTR77_002066 [Saxophila tyrrhenica]
MGNVSSRQDEGSPLYIRDQSRFSVAGATVTNSRGQVLLRVTPNEYPAHTFRAQKDLGDDTPVEYVQDPESTAGGPPSFLLRLNNSDELNFSFNFIIRQQGQPNGTSQTSEEAAAAAVDTQVAGLTYIFASSAKEVENLVVREFHSDPNLHKNPNVDLLGDYTTGGNPSVQFTWTWKWRPPKATEDRGGGWRNNCSFVEYNQRAHRLDTLVTFNFWVQNTTQYLSAMPRSPKMEYSMPQRLRVPSAQSIESRVSNVSDSEGEGSYKDYKEPQSPTFEAIPENGLGLIPSMTGNPVKVDVATCKPGEDPSMSEDGPVFRATMRSLESKTGNMRLRMKKVLRSAEAAEAAQNVCNKAYADFMESLRDASGSNANAVKPALDHYFEKIAKEIQAYEKQNSTNLKQLIIDPISKLYNIEIKQADFKKREFDEESKEYYSYVSKYLGQRSESLKEKQKQQSDEKYQSKRRTFELKRFDYSSFIHDLHGGRKDQEVLSQLTKYADTQARGYLTTAKKVEDMVPQLEALIAEVKAADQDYQLQRTEREEKRRVLEKSTKLINEDGVVAPSALQHSMSQTNGSRAAETDLGRSASLAGAAMMSQSPPGTASPAVQVPTNGSLSAPSGPPSSAMSTSPNNKFKGIRDLEEPSGTFLNGGAQRKEGLLWALSRPGSHVDPRGINKAAWHKFWIVLDQGRLSEYVNWKEKLDLHIDPIDLRMASVREARNSDRRFCFEVITPQFTRVYQAPSEEDMKSWIAAINNALQSAFESRSALPSSPSPIPASSTRKDIAAVLTGKSSSFNGHRQASNPNRTAAATAVGRHATTGDRSTHAQEPAMSSALLQRIRSADEGNKVCADCGAEAKVDWCSINLGVLLCIDCGGIHRSLGTHISKVRSLVLDTSVFTPDLIEILLLIGNRVSNMVWEAKLDRFLKPSATATREQRLHFITTKYSDRTYVQPLASSQGPDDYLLTSIKRNDIQSVLLALALGGNPNSHDRSRSTHALYLALAAADPALPAGGSGTSFSHSPLRGASPNSRPGTPTRKPFPVAELLLQNGAEVPTEQAPFPLSQAAKEYLAFKTSQRLGRAPNASRDTNSTTDQLSALPTITQGQSLSPSSISAKERERLLKRSSGSRQIRPDAIEGFARK